MPVILIELILWAALLFFFWVLKDGLGNVESDIEAAGLLRNGQRGHKGKQNIRFWRPQKLLEPIGSFRGEQIYRYAVFDDCTCRFDHIWPPDSLPALSANERCIEPGIVYRKCGAHDPEPSLPDPEK